MFKPSVRPRGLNAVNAKVVKEPKQRAERREVIRSAKISVDGDNDIMDCTIRDISTGGARISVARPADLPNSFMLICRADDMVARCQVAWRRGHEMGLRFVRKGMLYQEADFRRDQAHTNRMEAANRERASQTQNAFVASAEAEAMAANYRIMQLDPTLSYNAEQLKHRFRTLAMRAHPDQGGSVADFQRLTKAYNAIVAGIIH
ncbi:PilZ domain-containing protein [Pseudahrensia aquimaris]|uniref:PilZ domain-containing protein n=1 Tax=Pseudahrensia aquimaris TaxID=744461 RepID=A0ABW3FGR1_9HYPH